ncbi:MAG: Spy/CpxP family protein refolding chaperone [Nitrospirales bacterium]|nr:Spy/CpxP family protein refolding chaperone [Nitrospirales bacterium]
MKNWKLTGAVVGLAGILGGISLSVWANPPEGHTPHEAMPHTEMGYGGDHDGMHGHHSVMSPIQLKEELGLSDAQVTQLRPLEMDYRRAMIQNGADLRVAMVDLGSLLDVKVPDKTAIEAKVDEIGGVQKKMMMFRVETLLRVKEILTPDQYAQFQSRLQDRMEGIGHHLGGIKEGMEDHGRYPGKHHGKADDSGKGLSQERP